MIISPIDSAWRDWIQTLSWLGAVIGIVVALLKYISEQRQNREQRERELTQNRLELRWKQAEAGKKILDQMLSDQRALDAMKMLDWSGSEYEVKPGVRTVITGKDTLKALRVRDLNFDAKEAYVRDCFDSLFYFMAMIEHYIQSELVQLDDVGFPLDYYMRIINRNRAIFDTFIKHYELQRAQRFMERMDKYIGLSLGDQTKTVIVPTA